MAIHHALGDLVDHVVIIVKENHTFDNYFGTFPNAEGDAHLKHAENPPPDDPDHKHQTWEARASDAVHTVEYKEEDIPPYFALARQYTLCDHYFSEIAGPSTPNHLMLICADSPAPTLRRITGGGRRRPGLVVSPYVCARGCGSIPHSLHRLVRKAMREDSKSRGPQLPRASAPAYVQYHGSSAVSHD